MSMELVLMEQRDKAREEVEKLTGERDILRAEVERLKRELEQAIAERTPHDYGILKSQRDAYRDRLCASIKETEEARAEVEERKEALLDAAKQIDDLKKQREHWFEKAKKENEQFLQAREEVERLKDHIPAATKMTRAEPSRLEIAAMLLAGWLGNPDALSENNPHEWLLEADKLITAAKGGVE